MSEETKDQKLWPIITDMSLAEQRLFARHAGMNYGKVIAMLSPSKTQDEIDEMTPAERDAFRKECIVAWVDVITDPDVNPAFVLIAARREDPNLTAADVEARIDAGEWVLDMDSLTATADEALNQAAAESEGAGEDPFVTPSLASSAMPGALS